MTSSNREGGALNAGAQVSSAMPVKFDSSSVTSFWMSSSARMVRSSEILMSGMAEVARLEASLGQQYLQRSMSALQRSGLGAGQESSGHTTVDDAMGGADGLMAAMREIAEQFRRTIEASTQALFDMPAAAPAPAQSLAASIHIDDPTIKPRPGRAAGPGAAG